MPRDENWRFWRSARPKPWREKTGDTRLRLLDILSSLDTLSNCDLLLNDI